MRTAPDRWDTIERLYHAALMRPADERAAFLEEACAGDDALRREVESLLAQPTSADNVLAGGAVVAAAGLVTDIGMSAMTGRRIGTYQILAQIGAGGMGEVYRARDMRLGRDVAIKILSREFTSHPDRLARFEREARVLATLNHPHIGAIYGIEDEPCEAGPHIHALVLELIGGETLAERIARRKGAGLPINEALDIARQIADALDAAHEKGIVHRDLKPANIKITPEGVVKVLDFGLAKLDPDGSDDESQAPTITVGDTREGLIIGTAAYMSPEQARGQAVDKRTDIWAFGCVLYELLSRRAAFARDTITDTIAAVVGHEPDWSVLPGGTPVAVHRLLRRCLDKDSRNRLRDIGDARLELAEALAPADSVVGMPGEARRPTHIWIVAGIALILILAVAAAVQFDRMRTTAAGIVASDSLLHTNLRPATADEGVSADPALTRDGALLAYASDRAGLDDLDIWIQQAAGSAPLRLTHDVFDDREPTFSPDGSQIAFRSERDAGGVYIMPALGGQDPRLFVREGRRPRFSPDGRSVAYWTGSNIGLAQVSGAYRTFVMAATGGTPRELAGFTAARFPVWSEDGRALLVLGSREPRPVESTYDWWIVPLDGSAAIKTGVYGEFQRAGIDITPANIGPDEWRGNDVVFSDYLNLWSVRVDRLAGRASGLRRLTFGTSHNTQTSMASTGLLAFSSATEANSVWAIPLDANRGTVTGPPRRIAGGAGFDARATASADGRLVAYFTRTPRPSVLVKNLGTGAVTDVGVSASGFGPAISPDGSRVAYEAGGGVQVISTQGGSPTTVCNPCLIGDWSSDGRRLMVVKAEGAGGQSGRLTMVDTAGEARWDVITSARRPVNRPFLSPDSRLLAFRAEMPEAVMVAALSPSNATVAERDWVQLVPPESDVRPCGWSPDGTLLYFVSSRDGTRCLYAQRIERSTGKPQGAPFAVRHFHGTRNVWAGNSGVLSTGPGDAIRGGFFLYDIGTYASNVWTMLIP